MRTVSVPASEIKKGDRVRYRQRFYAVREVRTSAIGNVAIAINVRGQVTVLRRRPLAAVLLCIEQPNGQKGR